MKYFTYYQIIYYSHDMIPFLLVHFIHYFLISYVHGYINGKKKKKRQECISELNLPTNPIYRTSEFSSVHTSELPTNIQTPFLRYKPTGEGELHNCTWCIPAAAECSVHTIKWELVQAKSHRMHIPEQLESWHQLALYKTVHSALKCLLTQM